MGVGSISNKDGSPLNAAGKAEYKTDLINSMKEDAEKKILSALNHESPSESDHNVKEPILVFLDSTQPDAVINEKNELDKWDVPVNPQGEAKPGTPDHGEPEGGKNIVAGETTDGQPIYADWTEANTGEPVHYQLRVNAMNFIRTGNTDDTIEQVKEYFLADYQSGHMHFDESKGLKVSVWQGDNNNDSQADTKINVTKKVEVNAETGAVTVTPVTELDYTSKQGTFFKNTAGEEDLDPVPAKDPGIFGDGTGIMVPWVFVSEEDLTSTYPIYTITNVPIAGEFETEEFKDGDPEAAGVQPITVKKVNEETGAWEDVPGQYVSVNNRVVNASKQVLDEEGNPIQKTKKFYTYSIYNSDVTIVVDYWMILDDDAIVDEPGNKNYAQYGWSPVDNEDDQHKPKEPTNPKDDDKPSQKEEIDEATVYTFALAWVKVNEKGKALADAEFELPFYVKKAKDNDTYVFAFKELVGDNKDQYPAGFTADNCTNKVTTDATGIITIKGVEQSKDGEYSITETKAPAGYNKLTEPFVVKAKKSGPSVTTTTKTVIYLDSNGNVTETVTTATEEYKTEDDSNVANVPVYEYKPIVNNQGTELPSTGGIGTTIFYVIGAILVLGAGILLVTRRRMNA